MPTNDNDDKGAEGGQRKKRVAGGVPSTELILSAHVGGNANLFQQIMRLYVPAGSTVADVTYGKK